MSYSTVLGKLVKNSIILTEIQKEHLIDYTLYNFMIDYIDNHVYITLNDVAFDFLLYLNIRKSQSNLFRELKRLLKYRIRRIFGEFSRDDLIIKYNNKTYKKIDSKI